MSISTTNRHIRRSQGRPHRAVAARAVLAVGVALPLAAAMTTPAQAAEAVRCSGTITNRTIAGDLVVPAGSSCQLDRVTVTGDVKIGQYANLLIMSSTVRGSTGPEDICRPHGTYLNAYNTAFRGPVNTVDAWGAYLDRSTFTRADFGSCYRGPCTSGTAGPNWIYIRNSRFQDLSWAQAQITVDDSTVTGMVSGRDWGAQTSVAAMNRVNAGSAAILSAEWAMCGSSVGDTRFGAGSVMSASLPAVFGKTDASCNGNTFRGSLSAVNQGSPVTMNNNIVRGLAAEEVSYPYIVPLRLSGTGNRFIGGTTGAFTAFAQQPGNSTQSAAGARLTRASVRSDDGAQSLAKVRKASAQAKKELKAKEKEARQAAKRAGKVKLG